MSALENEVEQNLIVLKSLKNLETVIKKNFNVEMVKDRTTADFKRENSRRFYLDLTIVFRNNRCNILRHYNELQRTLISVMSYTDIEDAFMGPIRLPYTKHDDFSYIISPEDGSRLYILYYPSDATWKIVSYKEYTARINKIYSSLK
jgi:hypothetical protein